MDRKFLIRMAILGQLNRVAESAEIDSLPMLQHIDARLHDLLVEIEEYHRDGTVPPDPMEVQQ